MTPEHLHNALRQLATEALPVRIAGACLHPHVPDGGRVWVRRVRCYWPGDVIVLRAGDDRLLAHRLIGGYFRHRRWRWLTQADAARRPDASVPGEQILGRISGGDCSAQVTLVPLAHRLWALGRFARFLVLRLAGQ